MQCQKGDKKRNEQTPGDEKRYNPYAGVTYSDEEEEDEKRSRFPKSNG